MNSRRPSKTRIVTDLAGVAAHGPPAVKPKARAKNGPSKGTNRRAGQLMALLEERRQALRRELRGRIRAVRTGGAERSTEQPGEVAEVDSQDGIEFSLIQIKAEALSRVDEALTRLSEGRYGWCIECGDEIAAVRLRALPFAVRCLDCEESRETTVRDRVASRRRLDSGVADS